MTFGVLGFEESIAVLEQKMCVGELELGIKEK